jgi:hypothetical protein
MINLVPLQYSCVRPDQQYYSVHGGREGDREKR